MDYLPKGYEELKTSSNYISLSKLAEGEHRFRIVQRPIAGWIDWNENKPYRYRPDERPAQSFNPDKPMRPFWTCYVWDYSQNGLFIMEFTQSSILKALTYFGKDEEWGDFTNYDIKISKNGTGKETKYHVSPVPHRPLKEEIVEALKKTPVNLEALYQGGDPWLDLEESISKNTNGVTQGEADFLDNLIGNDNGLRENILNFLKAKGCGNQLIDMPNEMYEKMVERAMKNNQERGEQLKRQTSQFNKLNSDMDTIFGSALSVSA